MARQRLPHKIMQAVFCSGEGIHLWVLGMYMVIKALGNDTGGTYSIWENRILPGQGPPLHVHTQEEETWYVLEGELTWTVGDNEFHAKQGSFINLPRFVPHAFLNKSNKPARMMQTYAPAGSENWFLDIGTPATDPNTPPVPTKEEIERALKLGNQYGMVFTGLQPSKDDVDIVV